MIVDAFTKEPFGGNPAAVYLLPKYPNNEILQKIALEMNLAETSFVVKKEVKDKESHYDLRWFTPSNEVDICGHATLAAAKAIWTLKDAPVENTLVFHTRSGPLKATSDGDYITLDFPIKTPKKMENVDPLLFQSLGIKESDVHWVGDNSMDIMVEVNNPQTILSLSPDLQLLKKIKTRCVIVTSSSHKEGFDFISRVFAPSVGIDEDPVTGSAHCCTGPYWGEKLGKTLLNAYQASPRGGELIVDIKDPSVFLKGQAAVVASATLHAKIF